MLKAVWQNCVHLVTKRIQKSIINKKNNLVKIKAVQLPRTLKQYYVDYKPYNVIAPGTSDFKNLVTDPEESFL